MNKKRANDPHENQEKAGMSGIFGGLGLILEKLGELAEKGKELRESGEFKVDKDGNARGVYGFSVKVGTGKDDVKVEPFGNLRKDSKTGKTVSSDICDPLVDIFEESDHVKVIVELPGINPDQVQLEIHGDILELTASNQARKYHKEILLSAPFKKDKMVFSCRNGILEIRLNK